MKNVLIISNLILFSYVRGQNFLYKDIVRNQDFKIYDIDINRDGIKDKVAYNKNGNDLLFFVKQHNQYQNVYHGDNYNMDGIYVAKQIKGYYEGDHVLYIKNIFSGAGGQTNEYFFTYQNQKWNLSESVLTSDNFNEMKVCIRNEQDDKEKCITTENTHIISDITEKIRTGKDVGFYTKEYLFSLINLVPLTENSISGYENLAFWLLQVNRGVPSGIFLYNKILEKFPDRLASCLHIADAQWNIGEREGAKITYRKYIVLLKEQKKDPKKIPERVYERSK